MKGAVCLPGLCLSVTVKSQIHVRVSQILTESLAPEITPTNLTKYQSIL